MTSEALAKEDRNMAMLCHLASPATLVGIPLGMTIVATMRANDGIRHQYPLTMRFIK